MYDTAIAVCERQIARLEQTVMELTERAQLAERQLAEKTDPVSLAEIELLRARVEALARQLVDADLLHLADESDILTLTRRCEALETRLAEATATLAFYAEDTTAWGRRAREVLARLQAHAAVEAARKPTA